MTEDIVETLEKEIPSLVNMSGQLQYQEELFKAQRMQLNQQILEKNQKLHKLKTPAPAETPAPTPAQ